MGEGRRTTKKRRKKKRDPCGHPLFISKNASRHGARRFETREDMDQEQRTVIRDIGPKTIISGFENRSSCEERHLVEMDAV
jgi:hypothetical protein